MSYKWLNAGDQDAKIHKVCALGPIMLEIIEDEWDGEDNILMLCVVKYWNETTMKYKSIHRKPNMPYKEAQVYMENWYAENIIMPKLLMGTDNG